MENAEKIEMVQTLVDNDSEASESALAVYLAIAAEKILKRLYPFESVRNVWPSEYDVTQCELAARLFLRRGGEGELSHNENGVSRSYASVDDADILDSITPFAKVV